MPRMKKVAWLVLLPAVLAMLLAACSSSDDNDEAGGASTTGASDNRGNEDATKSGEPTAAANDNTASQDATKSASDDKKDDIEASGDTGSDKQYVAAMCKATRKYLDTFAAAIEKAFEEEFDEQSLEAFAKPFREMAEDLADAKPPKDLKEWHEGMVAAMNDLVKTLESGDVDSALAEDVEYPDMPADAQERLAKLAAENEDCKALEEEGGSIFE